MSPATPPYSRCPSCSLLPDAIDGYARRSQNRKKEPANWDCELCHGVGSVKTEMAASFYRTYNATAFDFGIRNRTIEAFLISQ